VSPRLSLCVDQKNFRAMLKPRYQSS
jgi:hypothetical protein